MWKERWLRSCSNLQLVVTAGITSSPAWITEIAASVGRNAPKAIGGDFDNRLEFLRTVLVQPFPDRVIRDVRLAVYFIRIKGIAMKLGLLLLAAAVLTAQQRNPRTTAADAAAGAKIFRSHCAECHGLNGEGGKGPNLTSGVYYHGSSDASLFRNITDGIDGTAMPGSFFSADQIWQVVTHLRALARTGSHTAPKGHPQSGSALFRAKGCSGCHMVRGEGGINGPDLSFIGSQRPVEFLRESILEPNAHVAREFWLAEVILENGAASRGFLMNEDTYYVQMLTNDQGLVTLPRKDFRKMEIRKDSIMPSYKNKLTESEVTDLISYLWTLQRPSATK